MNGFEYIFTLFGLLLGLALAEALGGLARAIKASHATDIGWPTALLGLFVACDVVTFWMYGWAMRDALPLSWPTLFGGFLVTAVYYLSASLIFPDGSEGGGWNNMDGHFVRHYRKVIGGVLFCNAALLATAIALIGLHEPFSARMIVITWSFFPVCVAAMLVKDQRAVLACLVWLIALYPLSAVWA